MKNKIFIFTIILFVFFTSVLSAQNRRVSNNVVRALRDAGIQALSEGVDLADFTLPALDGRNFTLSQQRGRVIFLNFWATWCPPCRDEMPSMEALYHRFKDREFDMIAVNLGESRETAAAFMRQNNLNFTCLIDTRRITGSMYGIQAIPATYIIDKRGLIVGRVIGAIDWNTPRVIAAFEALLAE